MRLFFIAGALLLSTTAFALTPRTQLLNGASAEVHDYLCVCKKLSNSTGKDVLVPWKTLAEWASYYNSVVAGLTKASCIGVLVGEPSLAIPNYNDTGNACNITTGTFALTDVQNSGGYALRINVPAAYFTAVAGGCTATLWRTSGGTTTSTSLVSGANDITLCNNDEFNIYFSCVIEGNHGHTVAVETVGGASEIDTFDINFTIQSGCVF